MNILVLCTGNSCRSQMLHGYLKQNAALNVYSAGIETHGLNPLAVKVLAEDGIDISSHTSNHIDEYREIDFAYIITVCDHANEHCPFFPANAERIHQNFTDPSKTKGSEAELLPLYRKTRDEIKIFAENFNF